MGFKNLKEILIGMERSELKIIIQENIESDLSATLESLRFDEMVSFNQNACPYSELQKDIYVRWMDLAKCIMKKYCNQIEEIDMPTYMKVCKELEIVPKIISIPHAYILFSKLLPVYAN